MSYITNINPEFDVECEDKPCGDVLFKQWFKIHFSIDSFLLQLSSFILNSLFLGVFTTSHCGI